jgi:trehalose-6-phosphate synthase
MFLMILRIDYFSGVINRLRMVNVLRDEWNKKRGTSVSLFFIKKKMKMKQKNIFV